MRKHAGFMAVALGKMTACYPGFERCLAFSAHFWKSLGPRMAAPAQLSESESSVVLEIRRFIQANPIGATEAAARLAHRLSDRASWGEQIAQYRETARDVRGMKNLTLARRRSMCREYRPKKDSFFNSHTAALRPYWRLDGEGKRMLLDAAGDTGDITVLDAWDTVLMLHVLMDPDIDAAGMRLGAIAEWKRKDGWGRLRAARREGLADATKRAGAFSRANGALRRLQNSPDPAAIQRENQPVPVSAAHLVDDWASLRPSPVHEAIRRFAGLFTRCSKVLKAWEALQAIRRPTHATPVSDDDRDLFQELPDEISGYAALQQHRTARRKAGSDSVPHYLSVRPWLPYLEARDDLTLAVRMWRPALDEARMALPTVAPWMDDQRIPAVQRWTADVQDELNRLGGLIDRLVVGDTPADLDRGEFERLGGAVAGRLAQLKRVPNVPPMARGVSMPESTPTEAAGVGPAISAINAGIKSQPVGDVQSLTADHEAILAVLVKVPTRCRTVIEVASNGTIRNRETVGLLLKQLATFGLVHRPHGKRKGYVLTGAGRDWVAAASG
jgi:hypothetical protein